MKPGQEVQSHKWAISLMCVDERREPAVSAAQAGWCKRERERAKQKHLQPRWADRADTGTITSLLQILKRGKQTDKQHVPLLCVIMSLTETKPKCRRTKVAARCANQCTCNLSSANVSDSIKAKISAVCCSGGFRCVETQSQGNKTQRSGKCSTVGHFQTTSMVRKKVPTARKVYSVHLDVFGGRNDSSLIQVTIKGQLVP